MYNSMATITRACVILWCIKSKIECKLNTLFRFAKVPHQTSDIVTISATKNQLENNNPKELEKNKPTKGCYCAFSSPRKTLSTLKK